MKNDQGDAVNHFHLVLKESRMYVEVSIISDIGGTRSHVAVFLVQLLLLVQVENILL